MGKALLWRADMEADDPAAPPPRPVSIDEEVDNEDAAARFWAEPTAAASSPFLLRRVPPADEPPLPPVPPLPVAPPAAAAAGLTWADRVGAPLETEDALGAAVFLRFFASGADDRAAAVDAMTQRRCWILEELRARHGSSSGGGAIRKSQVANDARLPSVVAMATGSLTSFSGDVIP